MRAAVVGAMLAGMVGLGCQPSIGDRCNISTDCSQRGDRLCDKSVSSGYCTIFNCVGNGCPDDAACVVFGGNVPGCGYSNRGISRSARSFCLKSCAKDSDCRINEGYACRRVVRPGPESAASTTSVEGLVLDDAQERNVCVYVGLLPDGGELDSGEPARNRDAAVCRSEGPNIDIPGPVVPDAGATDAGATDAGATDAGATDAGALDAGPRDAAAGGG